MRQSIVSLGSSLRSFQFPVFLFLLFFLLVIGDLLSSGRRRSSFLLLGTRRGVVTLESDGLSQEQERGRLFIPTGVERVAIPRGEPPWSCKSYEQDIRRTTKGKGVGAEEARLGGKRATLLR